jgi:hypothetical protein
MKKSPTVNNHPSSDEGDNKYRRLKIVQINKNGEVLKIWNSAYEIERILKMNRSAILRCCKGEQKKSYWYQWMFEDDYNKIDKKK